ncbi:MAG TPA: ABC transporter substrate-binding protein [Thermoanaerobaculia bacterium]|nr:ABC transporter substrate-binding protein [Thermoanaerobaculia bacterium]
MTLRVALVVLLTALIAGCNRTETAPQPLTAQTGPLTTPSTGGTLVRRLESDINTLNFILHTTEYENLVLSYLYAPLIDFDVNQKIIPRLAKSWEVSPDGRTYRFLLDEKATFDDGAPVRASDVLFTLGKIVDKNSGAFQLTSSFEGLQLDASKAIDDRTVEIVFAMPRASQLAAFNIAILPESVYGKGDFKKDFNRKVVGNGPYRLTRRDAGKEILLERRNDYWGPRPSIEKIRFKIISDDTVAWNAMKRGEIDEMSISSDRWRNEGATESVRNRMEIHRFHSGYIFVPWNNSDPLLRDAAIRRTLMMCLDRRAIIQNLYFGTARIMTGPFSPDQWTFNADVRPIEFNLEEARKSFAALGWRDSNGDGVLDKGGKSFVIDVLLHTGNKPSMDQAQIFQQALKQVGVTMNLVTLDSATFFDRIQKGEYQSAFLAQGIDVDADLDVSQFHSSQFPPNGNNWAFYSNPRVDKLITEGRAEFDQAKRLVIYRELHEILANDQPYGWTVEYTNKWGLNRRVGNVTVSNTGGLFFWYPGPLDWTLAETASTLPPSP